MTVKQDEMSDLDRRIAALRQQIEEQSQNLAELSREQPIALAGPEITLIDPQMPVEATRGMPVVRTRADVSQRPIIGKVDAPAGLLSLLLNDRPLAFDDKMFFQHEVPIAAAGTAVSIVAIDRQGKRDALEFALTPEIQVAALSEVAPEAGPGTRAGGAAADRLRQLPRARDRQQ